MSTLGVISSMEQHTVTAVGFHSMKYKEQGAKPAPTHREFSARKVAGDLAPHIATAMPGAAVKN